MRRRFFCGAFVGVLVIAAAISASAGGAAPSRWHGPIHMRTNSTSTNWSGYAVTGGRYTRVSSSWTVPAVKCSGTAYSSFWVGLDGDTSSTVEQTGTDSDCSGSTPRYYAWYEMYPKFPTNYSNLVKAGDHMSATVSTTGNGQFTKLTMISSALCTPGVERAANFSRPGSMRVGKSKLFVPTGITQRSASMWSMTATMRYSDPR